MRFTQRALAATLLSALALAAHADPTSAELRVMGVDVQSPPPPNGPSRYYEGRDFFNNGNPLNGMVYTYPATGAQLTGGYQSSTFSPGSELSGPAPDLAGRCSPASVFSNVGRVGNQPLREVCPGSG